MTTSIDHADLTDLRSRVRGKVHAPADADYPTLGFNLAVPRHPWAVVDVTDAADVGAAVRFASGHSLTVAVYNTGHGGVGVGGESLLLRTAGLDRCDIDPIARTARVGAGVRWQRVLDAAAAHGLAPLAGSAPDVGVVGFLTGGGIGPFVRALGVSADRIRSFEVVTGDGRAHRASAAENAELFWGLRGGKATLGIVTEVVIDLLPIEEFHGGALYFDASVAAEVAAEWTRWVRTLPADVDTSLAVLRLPELPGVPPPLAGRCTLAIRYADLGAPAVAAHRLRSIRAVATPVLDTVATHPYAALGGIHADPVDPMPVHERGALLRELTPETMAAFLAAAGPESGSPLTIVELRLLGGAYARTPAVPSAFCHRGAVANLMTIGTLVPPIADVVPGAADAVVSALGPWATGGELPNFGSGAEPDRIRRCYDEDTRAWLSALARRHDPAGVLAVGQVAR